MQFKHVKLRDVRVLESSDTFQDYSFVWDASL